MILKHVTFTGADETIEPMRLVDLTVRFPFVEWGILMSASKEGNEPRYPKRAWLEGMTEVADTFTLPMSGHVCGSWCRAILKGLSTFFDERKDIVKMFKRIQLNYHDGRPFDGEPEQMVEMLTKQKRRQYIFPLDPAKHQFFEAAWHGGLDVAQLYDPSGGKGLLPGNWKITDNDVYYGFAGGVSPDNLEYQLNKIAEVAGDREVWIDFESHIRSLNNARDSLFDLHK